MALALHSAERERTNPEEISVQPTHDDLRKRAYEHWEERGRPIGSPDIDWRRAELELSAENPTDTAHDGAAQAVEMERARPTGGQLRRHTGEDSE
jgi:hypothetical protein